MFGEVFALKRCVFAGSTCRLDSRPLHIESAGCYGDGAEEFRVLVEIYISSWWTGITMLSAARSQFLMKDNPRHFRCFHRRILILLSGLIFPTVELTFSFCFCKGTHRLSSVIDLVLGGGESSPHASESTSSASSILPVVDIPSFPRYFPAPRWWIHCPRQRLQLLYSLHW
jgi:hypothetical protein